MKIEKSNVIKIHYETEEEGKIIKKVFKEKLTFLDPSTFNTFGQNNQRYIRCYKESKAKKTFTINRGSEGVINSLYRAGIKRTNVVNNTQEGKDIQMKANFDFRDEIQSNAFDSFMNSKNQIGVLNLACGVGKTFVAMKIMEKIKKKTIILVDEVFLAQQWNEYLRDWTSLEENKDYMLIHGKMKKKLLDDIDKMSVIIASKDSLIKKPELIKKLNKDAGLMIIDECHIVSAKVFTKVAAQINTKWILGLSASIDRDDGMSFLVKSMVGDVLSKATIFDSVKLGSSILPELKVFFLKKSLFPYEFKSFKGKITESFASISKTILRDKYCMNYICFNIYRHYMENDSQLVITQRVEESEMYKEFLIRAGVKEEEIGVILGKTKPSERIRIIEAAKKKEIKIIITSKILDKGISCNTLEILHNVYPNKSVAISIQRSGRISRTTEGKTKAIVYDYIYDHPMFLSQFCNKKKGVSRLHAWVQCTNVPNSVKTLIEYIQKKNKGGYMDQQTFSTIREQVIDVDNIQLLIPEDTFYDR